MLALLGIFGVVLVVFAAGASLRIIPLAFVLMAVLGLTQAAFFPVINAMLVEAAPENMRGRVLGLLSLDRAMTAFGGFLAGVMAAGMGTVWAQSFFGAACVVTAVALFSLMPSLRRVH